MFSKTTPWPVFFLIIATIAFIFIAKQNINAQTSDFSRQEKTFNRPAPTSVSPNSTANKKETTANKKETTANKKATSDTEEEGNAEAIRQEKIMNRFWLLLQKKPREGAAFDRVYAWYAQTGQMQELFEKCTQWLAEDPQNAKAFLLKGLFAQRNGDSVLALNCYDKAALLDPNSAAPLICRSGLLARNGDLKIAADTLEKALLRNPDQEEIKKIMIPLMRLYERLGNKDQAQNVLTRYEALFPEDPEVQWQIANSLRETGHDRLALARFLHLAKLLKNKNSLEARQLWIRSVLAAGSLKIQQGQSESAENDFRLLLNDLDAESAQADAVQEQIARIFLRNGRYDNLIGFYRQLLKENPRQWKIAQKVAVLLIRLDRNKDAVILLSETLSKSPSNTTLLKTLLDLKLEEGEIEEAARIFHIIDSLIHWNPQERTDFLRARSSLFLYLKNEITSTGPDPDLSDHQANDHNHPDHNVKTPQRSDSQFHSHQESDPKEIHSQHSSLMKTDNSINDNINRHKDKISRNNDSINHHKNNIRINNDNRDNIDNINIDNINVKSSLLSGTKDLQALRRAVRINPTDEKIQRELLNALDEIGRTSEAVEILWAIFDHTFSLDHKVFLTNELFDHYRKISRLSVLTERLNQETKDPTQQRNNKICLAQVYSLSGDFESERRILTALFNENEGTHETDLDLTDRLVQLALKQGNLAEAIRFQQILCVLSDDPRYTKRLIQLYFSHGEKERAEKLFLKLSARINDPALLLHTTDQLLAAANYELAEPILNLLLRFKSPKDSEQTKINISDHWKVLYRQAEVFYWRGQKKEAAELFKKITSLPENHSTIPFTIHSGHTLSSLDQEYNRENHQFQSPTIQQWYFDRWNLLEKELMKESDSAQTIRMATEAPFDNTVFKTFIFTIFREKIRISDYYRKQFAMIQKENEQNFLFPRFPHYVPQTFAEVRLLSFLWRIKIIFDNAVYTEAADHSKSFQYPVNIIRELQGEITTDRQNPDDLETRFFLDIFPPLLYFLYSDREESFDSIFDLSLSEIKGQINHLALSGLHKYDSCAFVNFLHEIVRLNILRRFDSFNKEGKLDLIAETNTESVTDAQKLKNDLLAKAHSLRDLAKQQGKDKTSTHKMSVTAGKLSEEEMIGWIGRWMDNFLKSSDDNPSNTDLSEKSRKAFHENSRGDLSLFYKGYFALSLFGKKAEANRFLKRAADKFGYYIVRIPLLHILSRQAEYGTSDLLFDYTCLHPFEILTVKESEEMKLERQKYLSEIHEELAKIKNTNPTPDKDYSNREILLEHLVNAGLDLIVLPVWLQFRNSTVSDFDNNGKNKKDYKILSDIQNDLSSLVRDYVSIKTVFLAAGNNTSDSRFTPGIHNQNADGVLTTMYTFLNRSESPSACELIALFDEYTHTEQSQFISHLLITINKLDKKFSSREVKKSKSNQETLHSAGILPGILKKLEKEFQQKDIRSISNQISFLSETTDFNDNVLNENDFNDKVICDNDFKEGIFNENILNQMDFSDNDFNENRNKLRLDKKKLFHQLKSERALLHNSSQTVLPQHQTVLALLFLFDDQYSEAIECLDEMPIMNPQDTKLREFIALEISLRDTDSLHDRLLTALNRLTCPQRNDEKISDIKIPDKKILNKKISDENILDKKIPDGSLTIKKETNSHNLKEESINSRYIESQNYSEKELLKIRIGWQKLGKTKEANMIFNHLLAITQTPAIQYDLVKELQKKSDSLTNNEIDFLRRIAHRFESFSFQKNEMRAKCRDLALQLLKQSGKLDQTVSLLEEQLNHLQNQGSNQRLNNNYELNFYELQTELADLYLRVEHAKKAQDLIMKMESGMMKNSKRQLEFSTLCSRAGLSKMALKWRRTALENDPDLLIDQFEYFARQYEKEENISELIFIIRQMDKDKFRILFPKGARQLVRWMKIPSRRSQIIDYWNELWNACNSSPDEKFKIRWTLCQFSSVNVDSFFAPFLTEFVLDSLQPDDKFPQTISPSMIDASSHETSAHDVSFSDNSGHYISIHQIETWTYEGIETLSLSLLRSTKDLESLKKLRENVRKIIKAHNSISPAKQDLSRITDAVLLHILLDLKIGDIKNALLDLNRLEKDPSKAALLENAKPMLAVFLADLDDPDCQQIATQLLDELLKSKKMSNHASFLIERLNGLSVNQQIKKSQTKKSQNTKSQTKDQQSKYSQINIDRPSQHEIKKQKRKDQPIKDRPSTEGVGSAP